MNKKDVFSQLENIFEQQRKLFENIFNGFELQNPAFRDTSINKEPGKAKVIYRFLYGDNSGVDDSKVNYNFPNNACEALDEYLTIALCNEELKSFKASKENTLTKLGLYCLLSALVSPEFAFTALNKTESLDSVGMDYSYQNTDCTWLRKKYLDPELIKLLQTIHDTIPFVDKLNAKVNIASPSIFGPKIIAEDKSYIKINLDIPSLLNYKTEFNIPRSFLVCKIDFNKSKGIVHGFNMKGIVNVPRIYNTYLRRDRRVHQLDRPFVYANVGSILSDIYSGLLKVKTAFDLIP